MGFAPIFINRNQLDNTTSYIKMCLDKKNSRVMHKLGLLWAGYWEQIMQWITFNIISQILRIYLHLLQNQDVTTLTDCRKAHSIWRGKIKMHKYFFLLGEDSKEWRVSLMKIMLGF